MPRLRPADLIATLLFLVITFVTAIFLVTGTVRSAKADGFSDLFGSRSIHTPGFSNYRGPGTRAELAHSLQAKGLHGAIGYAASPSSIDPFPPERTLERIQTGVHGMVTRSALRHGVPPALAHGVVRVESGYKCGAKNPRSTAKGIMQVLDRTAAGVGVHGNRRDCATGLEAGMRYLKQAYRRAGGNWCGAASLYNRGIGNRPSCTGYGRKVVHQARL